MWWTADPPRPFQLCPVPICSALRFLVSGLPPVFIYRRFHVYLKESRIPIESPLMVRPLLLAEPGPGDASCTTWTLTVSFHIFTFRRVGLPVNSHSNGRRPFGLRRPFPIYLSSPLVSGLATFLSRFQSPDFLRSFPVSRPSSLVSNQLTFSVRFRPYGLLLPVPIC